MTLNPTRTQNGGSQQEAQSPAELRKHRLRWWTLAVVSVTLVLETIDETILNVALPTLQQELGRRRPVCSGWSTPTFWSLVVCC